MKISSSPPWAISDKLLIVYHRKTHEDVIDTFVSNAMMKGNHPIMSP